MEEVEKLEDSAKADKNALKMPADAWPAPNYMGEDVRANYAS